MSQPDFFASSRQRHYAEVDDGKHDEQCEWRPWGFYLCHCSKRARQAQGYTQPPGPLGYSYPTCPRCYEETDHDGDSFRCYGCKVSWNPNNQDDEGEFVDDHGELEPPPPPDDWNAND